MHTTPARLASMTSLVLAALLAACGGAGSEPEPEPGTAGTARLLAAAAGVIPPLLDDQGHPSAAVPQAVPADTAARTRSRRYATPEQAAMLESRLGGEAIPVTVEPGPDAGAAVDLATQMVFGHQVVHDLSTDAPVLVRGPDLRLAAAAVHQLEVIGYSRVFLVTR